MGCVQVILVKTMTAQLVHNVKYLNQLVKHFVIHHVIWTMEAVHPTRHVHYNLYNASELLVHLWCSVNLVSGIIITTLKCNKIL